jgi:hypothetical protein
LQDFEADFTTIFNELNGETLTYNTSPLNVNISSWLIIDNSTQKMSGTPPQMDDQILSFLLYAYDVKLLNTNVNITFIMDKNDPPQLLSAVPNLE